MDTPQIILICIILCFGFGLESIFGFAGTIISLTILSFFFDIKDMVLLSIFASSFGSLFIFLSDYASFHSKAFWETLLFGLPGLLLGTCFLKNFEPR